MVKNQGETDVLKLVNGDTIVGKVRGISERAVSFTAYEGDTLNEIEREKLLYVRFSREVKPLPLGVEGTVVFLMRSGERISGEFVSLKEEEARIKSELAGVVEMRRDEIRKVIFREFP